MYLLDTDHISIIQRQSDPEYSVLVKHFEEHDSGAFFVPIISFHEQVTGWNAYLNRARTVDSIVRAYAMFQRILQDFASLQIAPFDVGAANTFENLRQS